MKKQSMFGAKRSQVRRAIPAFGTEAEEAEWWFQNRKVHENQLVAAANTGEAQILTREKLMERIAASRKAPAPVVALRIPQSDLALARKQAAEKGLPYQTYIKSLSHETLVERERRKVRQGVRGLRRTFVSEGKNGRQMALKSGIEIPVELVSEVCGRYGISEFAVFGSAARGDMGEDSDIDVMVEFSPEVRVGMLRFAELNEELERLLGRRVDLVTKGGLKPWVRGSGARSAGGVCAMIGASR